MKNFSILCLMMFASTTVFADFPIYKGSTKDYGCEVAYNSTDNEYLVIWLVSNSSQMKRLLAKRVNENGQAGAEVTISEFALGLPSVAYHSQQNEYLVTFVSGIAPDLSIYGQRLSSTGAKIGSTSQFIPNANNPTILYNSIAGNYLVIGEEKTPDDLNPGHSYTHLYSRKIGADGQPLNPAQIFYNSYPTSFVNTDAIDYTIAYAPVISSETPQGRYLVNTSPSSSIMLDSDGNAMLTLTNPQSGQKYPWGIPFQESKIGIAEGWDVAFGYWYGKAVFLVVWAERDEDMTWQGFQRTGIWCGVLDAVKIDYLTTDGASTETFPISNIASHWAYPVYAETWNPVVEYNYFANKFMVAWRETPGPDPQNDTQVNHIRGACKGSDDWWSAATPANIILSATNGTEDPYHPALAVSFISPNALVVWEDNRNSATTQADIYASLLTTTPAPSITINEPNGGEKWYVGSTHDIWWTNQYYSGPVKVEYSTDGGLSFKLIANIPANQNNGIFSWKIPNEPSTNCLVRVTDANNAFPLDESDSPFTILSASLTLIAPNGSEKWWPGTTQNITWSSENILGNDISIEYSTDNGKNYSFLGFHTNNQQTETWQWDAVPNTPSTHCLVRISLLIQNVEIFDVSDAPFTILLPKAISTIQELQNIKNDLNGSYYLANDIDASVTKTWNNGQGFEPIGTSTSPFKGELDGKGFAIKHLIINRPNSSDIGLIGFSDTSSIIRDISLNDIDVSGNRCVGGLAGSNRGTISHTSVTGVVSATCCYAGGLVGVHWEGSISDSRSSAAVICQTGSYLGGLVGITTGSIEKCSASGNVTGGGIQYWRFGRF